jgi:spermidine dehydrogenase
VTCSCRPIDIPCGHQGSGRNDHAFPRSEGGPSRKRVVVVGAGLAGLSAALRLSADTIDIRVLEAASLPGGNAWFETWDGLRLPTAGSCFRSPEPGGEVEALLATLGLAGQWRSTGSSMQVLFRTGALMAHLHEVTLGFLRQPAYLLKPKVWGLTAGLVAAALTGRPLIKAEKALGDPIFADLYRFLSRLVPGGGCHPAVPWTPACGVARAEMEMLDRMTIRDFLFDPKAARQLPPRLRPPRRLGGLVRLAVETTLRVEGLLLDTCSAYVGLHFLVGYLHGDLVALHGGNGAVSERLIAHLRDRAGVTVSTDRPVAAIEADGAGYRVRCDNGETLACDGVVVAAAKSVALSLLPDLPAAQRDAMGQIQYSDYVIVNARLKAPVRAESFGGYYIGDRPDPTARTAFCQAGGIVNANWSAGPEAGGQGGLSFLKPVALREDQGRTMTTDPATMKAEAEAEVRRALAAIGQSPDLLAEITLHRWPKGLVSPRPGQLADDIFARASAPFGNIVFANQDCSGVGSLESAVGAGERAARQLKDLLASQPAAVAAQ